MELVSSKITEHGLAPDQLELELTERMLMSDVELTVARMTQLRKLGVRIAMDDFGSGNSSLGYLVRLPIDTIKIDRAFVQDVDESEPADRVIQAIVSMARGIGLEIVAEGIETEPQRSRVIELGCDRLQGFLLGRPVPAAEIEQLVFQGRH